MGDADGRREGVSTNLWFQQIAGGPPHQLTHLPDDVIALCLIAGRQSFSCRPFDNFWRRGGLSEFPLNPVAHGCFCGAPSETLNCLFGTDEVGFSLLGLCLSNGPRNRRPRLE